MSESKPNGVRVECMNAAPSWQPPSSDELRNLMDSIGYSPREVGEFLGVSRKAVNRWTLGQETIPFANWVLLCRRAGWGFSEYQGKGKMPSFAISLAFPCAVVAF